MTTVDDSQRELVSLQKLRERLAEADCGRIAEINAAVDRAIRHFADAPIREFVPLLVERLVRDELRKGT